MLESIIIVPEIIVILISKSRIVQLSYWTFVKLKNMHDDIISLNFIEIGFCGSMNSHGRGIDSCVYDESTR